MKSASDVTGILPVANGGTGWSNLAAGAIPYGNGASALATTSAGTAGYVLAYLNGVPTWTATTTLSTISGTLSASQGGTGTTTWQTGSIPFYNGTRLTENNANLFWDNTDGRLGIGTTSPTAVLTLDSSSPNGTIMRVSNSSTGGHIYDWLSTGSANTGGAGRLDLFDYTAGAARLSIASSGNIGIGTTTPGFLFSVQGVGNWTAATSTYYSTGGLNLAAGCFAVGGNCLSLGNLSGTVSASQGGTGVNNTGAIVLGSSGTTIGTNGLWAMRHPRRCWNAVCCRA